MKKTTMNLDDVEQTKLQNNIMQLNKIVDDIKMELKRAKRARRNAKRNLKDYLKTREAIQAQVEAQKQIDAIIADLSK